VAIEMPSFQQKSLHEASRWLGVGFITLGLALSFSLFLPVQFIASTLTSINMGQIGFAYLALLVIGGLLLLSLLGISSIVLRAVGWLKFCRFNSRFCLQLLTVIVLEPFALITAFLHLLTFNGNFSLAVTALWLGVLVEYAGILSLTASIRNIRINRLSTMVLLSSFLGYLVSTVIVIMASSARNILISSLSHLAASSIASISLAATGIILLLLTARREEIAQNGIEVKTG